MSRLLPWVFRDLVVHFQKDERAIFAQRVAGAGQDAHFRAFHVDFQKVQALRGAFLKQTVQAAETDRLAPVGSRFVYELSKGVVPGMFVAGDQEVSVAVFIG